MSYTISQVPESLCCPSLIHLDNILILNFRLMIIRKIRRRRRLFLYQLFIALIISFQLVTIIGNIAVSFLLGEYTVKRTSPGSPSTDDTGCCSLQLNSNVKIFEREPSSSQHRDDGMHLSPAVNGLFDAHFLHFLINWSDFNGVDGYTSYTLQVLGAASGAGAAIKGRRRNHWQSATRDNDQIIHDVTSFRYSIDFGPCS